MTISILSLQACKLDARRCQYSHALQDFTCTWHDCKYADCHVTFTEASDCTLNHGRRLLLIEATVSFTQRSSPMPHCH